MEDPTLEPSDRAGGSRPLTSGPALQNWEQPSSLKARQMAVRRYGDSRKLVQAPAGGFSVVLLNSRNSSHSSHKIYSLTVISYPVKHFS